MTNDAKELLQRAKVVLITISDFGQSVVYRAVFPYFKVWVLLDNCTILPIIDENNVYWNRRKEAYAMNVYGTDRVFELIYSLVQHDYSIVNEIYKKVKRLF